VKSYARDGRTASESSPKIVKSNYSPNSAADRKTSSQESTLRIMADKLANSGDEFHNVFAEVNAMMVNSKDSESVNPGGFRSIKISDALPIQVVEYQPGGGDNEILMNDEEVELEITQDSGSITNVLNPEDLPKGCNVVAGANRPFVGANGGTIKNHGTADTDMVPGEGQGRQLKCRWTCADVTRPLISTGVTCDSGYEVLYTDTESLVVPKGSLSKHLKGVMIVQRYVRQGKGLYTTKMRVKAHRASPFTRQSGTD
jgi:hypothetical protein